MDANINIAVAAAPVKTAVRENQAKQEQKQESVQIQEAAPSKEFDKVLDKILRRPRSRKYMKALKNADLPTLTDEQIMETLRERELQKGIDAETVSQMVFEEEDIEAFKREIEAAIAEDIAKEEEERRRREEAERKRLAEEAERRRLEEENTLLGTLAVCYVKGCQVHSVNECGILAHYKVSEVAEMEESVQKAAALIVQEKQKSGQDTWVEVYKRRLVHISGAGDVLQVYKL